MGCYYRVVAFEFLGCDRAFCLFVLSPHYDQTAIGYKLIQGNIILEIFLQDLLIIFGNLYVNTKIHGHVLKKFVLTSEEFRQLWRSWEAVYLKLLTKYNLR